VNYSKRFVEESSLTLPQFESLLLYRRVLNGEIGSGEAAKMRATGPVSVGSYQRVVKQGLVNLQQAVVTVLLGAKMGLLKREELKKLVDMVSISPENMPEEQEEAFVTLVHALVKKIVM
jgi:hypothetical protein